MSQAEPHSEVSAPFEMGPAYCEGPEFAEQVKKFLSPWATEETMTFVETWLACLALDRWPSWQDLRLHRVPQVLKNTLLLERTEDGEDFQCRFVGAEIILKAGLNAIGARQGDFASGPMLEEWHDLNEACLSGRTVGVIDFDLGFIDKEYRKVRGAFVPLATGETPDAVACCYTWAPSVPAG